MIDSIVRRIYLHTLTPLHSGVGQAAAIVDLPIAREKATGWPVVPGSSVKGVLRAKYEAAKGEEGARAVFGSKEGAGLVSFTDPRILCLPVRSYFGTFAWVTSPLALGRFLRDATALGVSLPFDMPGKIDDPESQVYTEAALGVSLPVDSPGIGERAAVSSGKLLNAAGTQLILEDIDLDAAVDDDVAKLADALASEVFGTGDTGFRARLAIVPDGVFDYLCETGTEVHARIALGEGGTTSGKGGNLWYEEAVPAEAIFSGWAIETRGGDTSDFWAFLGKESTIQIGGNSSVGRGLCRVVVRP